MVLDVDPRVCELVEHGVRFSEGDASGASTAASSALRASQTETPDRATGRLGARRTARGSPVQPAAAAALE